MKSGVKETESRRGVIRIRKEANSVQNSIHHVKFSTNILEMSFLCYNILSIESDALSPERPGIRLCKRWCCRPS